MHWCAEPCTRKGNAYITSKEEKKQICRGQKWLYCGCSLLKLYRAHLESENLPNLANKREYLEPFWFNNDGRHLYLKAPPRCTQRKPAGSKRDPPHTPGFALRSGALKPLRATADGSVGRLRIRLVTTWHDMEIYHFHNFLHMFVTVRVNMYIYTNHIHGVVFCLWRAGFKGLYEPHAH